MSAPLSKTNTKNPNAAATRSGSDNRKLMETMHAGSLN
jgi:hypothetical protein